ncbi:PrgI family protein [Lactococcus formosensis subsp. formosensis]|uniref:PrgI family protein n=1 Tax=Lactococcus TaxID=1357 RepID=UPI003132D69B
MASSRVYKDITKYKAKYLGKDLRNIVGIIGVTTATLLNVANALWFHLPNMFTYLTIAFIAAPSFLYGFGVKDNMPLERYFKRLFVYYASYRTSTYQKEGVETYDHSNFIPSKDEKEYDL